MLKTIQLEVEDLAEHLDKIADELENGALDEVIVLRAGRPVAKAILASLHDGSG